MGYNLKTNYFNLSELEKRGISITTISSIFGSPTFEATNKTNSNNFVVDLKLGSLIDIEKGLTTNLLNKHSTSSMDPFSPTGGSSKRPRAPSGSGQIVTCLVDGCKADLSKCRDYHRRHKVCEMHSKTPRVTINGNEQRFCQQCSRFHSLGEFDEGKRSCRKRLEGHNRRRRKPQPEPLPVNHGNFLSATQGTSRYLAFGNQPIIPATSVVTTSWSGPIKSENNPTIYNNSSVSSPYSHTYRGRQFPFLQVPESSLSGVSSVGQSQSQSQTLHHHDTENGGSNNNNQKSLFCNGLTQVLDSDRALSLLSSNAETTEMGLGRIIHNPSPINPTRPMIPGLNYSLSSQFPVSSQGHGLEGFPESSGMFSNMRSNNNLCQDVFPNDNDTNSGSGGHQTLSFSWE